jgi:glycosyltransferase involved in cell wall biosynthesis
VNVDGLEWEREKWGKIAKRVFRNGANATARWATRLIADSQAIAEIWANEFSREPVFIPYGGTIQSRTGGSRAFRDLKLKSSDYVLVVARLAPENNVDLALDAIEMFEQRPELIVVGSANYANETERRLHALQKAGKAKWLGHVADQELLNDLWSHCGAYVHGHSVGGTNPALVQALAAGAPTLALATEFNREVIGNQQQLYEPNRDDLARKLKQLLKDSGLRERFVRHGQARVAANYQWKDVCAAYLDELSRAASSTR